MYEFDGIEDLQRKRDIEADGTELGLPGGITLIVRAASDGNPLWKAQAEKIGKELRRLRNARATSDRLRAFLAPKYAELLVKDWRGVKIKGVDIPYSVEACTAFLKAADDAYAAIDEVVWDTQNFRGARIEAVVEHAGN